MSTPPSPEPKFPITILGAGITGLATAHHLTNSPLHANKYKVTIIARDLPGDFGFGWASPWAGAIFQPQPTTSLLHQRLQNMSFTFYRSLALSHPHDETGVKILPTTEYFDAESTTSATLDDANAFIREMMPDFKVLSADELPLERNGITSGVTYTSLAINPTLVLPWLRNFLETAGVKFIRAEVSSFREARELSNKSNGQAAKVLVNATGIGAKSLANDGNVVAVRGQTIFVKSNWEKLVIREGSEYTYVIPRPGSGGVILGGVKGVASDGRVEADVEVRKDILRRVRLMCGAGSFEGVGMDGEGGNGDWEDIVGFRPGRKDGLRIGVERAGDEGEAVIHAYGMGGAGYIYSFGVAERVRELILGLEG